jgi:hypothetical protein
MSLDNSRQLMALAVGARLGHYTVTAKIGEGGMGEVYQARDTTLDRDVALKVLPEAFTQDPDRLARFEREAKVLASLNHPNIGSIYGLEEQDGVRALVLELVEGPRDGDRHGRLNGPRAGEGEGHRQTGGRVGVRCGAVRDADRLNWQSALRH